jgi:NitT/TauT family transport system substrate-binding protein
VKLRFIALFCAVVLQSAGIAPSDGQGLPTTVNVAGAPVDGSGTLFYAADMGFYEKAGLSVKFIPMNNTAAIAPAIISGTVTFGSMPLAAIALARERHLPLVIVAPAGLYTSKAPTSGIIVLKGSSIRRASDLNRKTVGVLTLSNMNYYGAAAWINKNGGDSKSVRWIEINESQALAGLEAGRLDAAAVSEPALDDAVRGEARLLAPMLNAVASRFLLGAFCATEEYARLHPDTVRKFAEAILESGAWANKNHVRSGQILEKYAVAPVPDGIARVTYPERVDLADVQPVLDLLAREGILQTRLRASDLFDAAVLRR